MQSGPASKASSSPGLYSLLNPGAYRDLLWPGTLGGPTGEFLGFGMIGLFIVSLAVSWRKRGVWTLAGVAVVATMLSWGSIIWLSPDHYIITTWLPWGHFLNLPVFENITPKNFATVADLAVVMVIAIGLDTVRWSSLGERLRTAARSVAVVAIVVVATLPIWLTYAAPSPSSLSTSRRGTPRPLVTSPKARS